MDMPEEWHNGDAKAAFSHRPQIAAPDVVLAATHALLGGDPVVFTQATMQTRDREVRWDLVAVTGDRVVRTIGTRSARYWHAGDESAMDPAPQVRASARPLADTVAVDLADVQCRQVGGRWEMTGQFTATFADGEMLVLSIDHRDEVERKFADLMGLFSRAVALQPQRREHDVATTSESADNRP